jgi:glutaminyl-peptide cyclotransferase
LNRLLTLLGRFIFLLLILSLLAGCDQVDLSILFNREPATPEQLVPQVLSAWSHAPDSFTEGLFWYNGFLYESSGLYGTSSLRKVDPQTGLVLQRVDDPTSVFGEGIALNGNRLFQLTWREKIAYVYDLNTFTQVETVSYDGEGWGLCFDGRYFFMSNGSASILKRDPQSFAVLSSLPVTQNGEPISQLNELECVGNSLYANVWKTNTILRISKSTGHVTGVIDASGLLTPEELAQTGPEDVLNGIAYDPDRDVFLITGKRWPKLFEVKFIPKVATGDTYP